MEKRKAKILFTKSGAGSRSTRITLPVSWIDVLNITQEDREVTLSLENGKIIISKDDSKDDNNEK